MLCRQVAEHAAHHWACAACEALGRIMSWAKDAIVPNEPAAVLH